MISKSAIETAIALNAAGRGAEAEALCHQILARDAASVEALCVLATITLTNAGGGSQAGPWLHRACALQPSYPPVHYYLAIQRSDRGDIDGMRFSARRGRALLDSNSEMAASLKTFAATWAWLDDKRLPRLASKRRTPSTPTDLHWLFVWRDLSEVLYHFDRSHAGSQHTLWLPARNAPRADRIGNDLVRLVEKRRPDIVAFLPGTAAHGNPGLGVFQAIRRHGIPTALIVPDLRKLHWQGVVASAAQSFDLIVSLDGCTQDSLPGLRGQEDRFFRGWAPISAFSPIPHEQRPFSVNLVGSLWGLRVGAVNALVGAGIEVMTRPPSPPGPREIELPSHKTLSNESYFDLLQRSRLTVNFSACSTGDGHQLKARVFEAAACGSMLLESRNDMTRDYFEEGEEFVYFTDFDDLIAKVKYHLAHPERTAAIAAAAHKRFLDQYAAPQFWHAVYAQALRRNRSETSLP